jgi:geranylgeranyl diphosphate synthase, type II
MPFKSYLQALEEEIKTHVYGSKPSELYEPINYIMQLGGKRMRPCLTLLAANLWLFNWQKAIKPALAVEVFHNFSLMHDDIMDQAPLRRGQATVHQKWDTNRAILSGDVMLVAAYEHFDEVDETYYKRVIKRFNKTASEVCEGQMLDMLYAENENINKEDYIEMIRLKTSVLLGFALELGGIIAGADDASIHALYEIGQNTGLGFQLHDDILDLYGDPLKFGKKIGGDIIENKKTWLFLDAKEAAEKEGILDRFQSIFANPNETAKINEARDLFDELGVKDRAEKCADVYFENAFGAIESLQISEDKKEKLNSFVKQIKNRES